MAHQISEPAHTTHTTHTTTVPETIENPSKMHAVKEKFVGGLKETIGTVVHSESMKESGREQKREGDAEALAAGKGDKHYDPALARKGVGIQHKHMGPNPKKITEGPCAGCKEGTCQIGHDYDAAIVHSVTQGHAHASHVPVTATTSTVPLRDNHVCTDNACCGDRYIGGTRCNTCTRDNAIFDDNCRYGCNRSLNTTGGIVRGTDYCAKCDRNDAILDSNCRYCNERRI
eukprot:TRINITY_DN13_c1_g1_i1.p1 TRINITY_DN13_c1_g1~~TRINITY_DN13_c1_g1_i1.p1  ORF type:complete len:230 (+),score=22.70 TRINITY_DN13_c1_g1_i1:72-761(+)